MPTTMTAQNGAVMTQTTKIAVAGCPSAAAAKAAASKARTLKGTGKSSRAARSRAAGRR
jgi:hypothetical protein